MTGKTFKLPNGEYTSNSRRYISEWRKLTEAIERALDARVSSFDPGVAVSTSDGEGTCVLPLWIAKKIAAMPPRRPQDDEAFNCEDQD